MAQNNAIALPNSVGANISTMGSVDGLILFAINTLFGVLGALAVVGIIMSGLQYISAGPDSQKAEKAKKTLLACVIGIAVVIFAGILINFSIDFIDDFTR